MDEVVEILKNIWNDMQEPIGYLPQGLLVGLAAVPLLFLWQRLSGWKEKGSLCRIVGSFLCIVYVAVVWNTVFFSREPGSRTGANMQLFGTWGDTPVARGYVIENVILFLPFGVLIPWVIPLLRKG